MSQLPPPSYDHEKLNIENVISEKPPSYSVTNNSIHGQQSHLAPQYPSQSNAVFVPAQIVPSTSGNTSRTVNMVTTYQTIPACTVIPEQSEKRKASIRKQRIWAIVCGVLFTALGIIFYLIFLNYMDRKITSSLNHENLKWNY